MATDYGGLYMLRGVNENIFELNSSENIYEMKQDMQMELSVFAFSGFLCTYQKMSGH